jgi:hypothetical protein
MIDYEDRDWPSMTVEHTVLAMMHIGPRHSLTSANEICAIVGAGAFEELVRLRGAGLIWRNGHGALVPTWNGLDRLNELDG